MDTPVIEEPADDGDCDWWWLILVGILLILVIILLLLPRKKVTFNSMGGTAVKPKRVLKNGKIKAPRNPYLRRRIFIGWFKDPACTIPWRFDRDKVEEDITLYAKWL